MRLSRTLALGAATLVLISACSSGGGGSPSAAPSSAAPSVAPSSAAPSEEPSSAVALPTVRIGSDNFYESKLMAEIYAQVLENAGYTVERNLGLGSRQERVPAFEGGQVDLVPEYVGSGLGSARSPSSPAYRVNTSARTSISERPSQTTTATSWPAIVAALSRTLSMMPLSDAGG